MGQAKPWTIVVMMKIWDRAEQLLVGVLGMTTLALALWQVASRYFFPEDAISYAEEVIVYLLIWAIMIVSSQLVRTDGHVRPDLVLKLASVRVKRWIEIFNNLAGFVFCSALTWYAWRVVGTALTIDEHSATNLRFPMWIYDAALPTGSFLMSIRYIIRLAGLLAPSNSNAILTRHPGGHEPTGVG
jgi:C4-dicarboxylate transporter DctQ subunit